MIVRHDRIQSGKKWPAEEENVRGSMLFASMVMVDCSELQHFRSAIGEF